MSFSIYYPQSISFFYFPPFGFLLLSPWWEKLLTSKPGFLCPFGLAAAACLAVCIVRLLSVLFLLWRNVWHESEFELGKLIYFFCILGEVVVVCCFLFICFLILYWWKMTLFQKRYCWLQVLVWVLVAAAVEEALLLKEKKKPTEWTIYKILITTVLSHWHTWLLNLRWNVSSISHEEWRSTPLSLNHNGTLQTNDRLLHGEVVKCSFTFGLVWGQLMLIYMLLRWLGNNIFSKC